MIALVVLVVLLVATGAGLGLRGLRQAAGEEAGNGSVSATAPTAAAKEPGSPAVRLVDDAAAHPRAAEVRSVVQDYFDAINAGDYQLWSKTVTSERARELGQSAWQRQYRSTLDGSIVVHRLEARPDDGLVVLLSFTSVQDPADAPPDMPVRCLRWRVSYPLIVESDELRLAPTSPAASLRTPC
jgi:hypothetical protein